MRSDDKFYTLAVIFMIIFTIVFVAIEFFNLDMLVVGFIVFGIPVITMSAVFWYDLINSFLNS